MWLLGGGLIVLLVALAYTVQQQANSPGSGPTPTPPPAPAWTPPDCSNVQFGAPLAAQPGKAGVRTFPEAPAMQIDVSKKYLVRIQTSKGTIELCLDPQLAPQTVNNFVFLARNKFYDGLTFHRVEPGFVIQGGDPNGDGMGGPGYTIAEEPVKGEYIDGAVAMAKAQAAHTTGSQFFIDIDDNRARLSKLYSLFGVVSMGLDVAKKIAVGDVMQTVTVQQQT
jgi:cyclophilin family peptidyl-prolyl cis-trans isomerase